MRWAWAHETPVPPEDIEAAHSLQVCHGRAGNCTPTPGLPSWARVSFSFGVFPEANRCFSCLPRVFLGATGILRLELHVSTVWALGESLGMFLCEAGGGGWAPTDMAASTSATLSLLSATRGNCPAIQPSFFPSWGSNPRPGVCQTRTLPWTFVSRPCSSTAYSPK